MSGIPLTSSWWSCENIQLKSNSVHPFVQCVGRAYGNFQMATTGKHLFTESIDLGNDIRVLQLRFLSKVQEHTLFWLGILS